MADILEELKQRYRRFADDECGEYGALYFKLSHAVALDNEILRFLEGLTDRQPNLFFAAVHYLTGSEKMPSNASELSVFVRENRDALAAVMRSHHTQTNAEHLRFRLGRTHFSKEHARRELLALGHYHGWDLEWLGTSRIID